MKLLQFEHERRGDQNRLKIHVIPTKFIDRSGKTRTMSPKFSWGLTRYHADRHPLNLAIHRATGLISGELNDHRFGARLLGFGEPDKLSPIDYKQGKWRRGKDKRTVYFDGGGFELSLALVGTSMKQTVEIRDRSLLRPLVERLWLNSAKHEVHKTKRVACVTERGLEEWAEQIKLEVAGEVIGQINQGFVYNAEHHLPLTYRVIEGGEQILLVTELPAEVQDWALPIFIDPTTSFGFTRNCGVCNYTVNTSTWWSYYTDHQHPTAMSNAAVASQANLWSDPAYTPTIDDNGVFYADIYLPHYWKTIIRNALKMSLTISNYSILGSSPSAGQVKATLLPYKMRPVDMYRAPTGAWTRDASAYNERSGMSPLAVFSSRDKVYDAAVYQRGDLQYPMFPFPGAGFSATLFDGGAKTGGRLQEMFNDFLNSDREDSLTLMVCAKASGGFTGLQLDETSPFTLSIDWSNYLNENPRASYYTMPPTEPSISFVEDKIVAASGLMLYSAMGVSTRDMEAGDQLQDNWRDPFKLDQRMNVRDDYYYFDGYAAPFNHVPNPHFLRTLQTVAAGGTTATTSSASLPDYTTDVAEANKLVLTYFNTSPQTFGTYFGGSDFQTTSYHHYLIPLHNLEFLYPHTFQMWVRSAVSTGWRAAIVQGYDFVAGKWNAVPIKSGSTNIGAGSASWTSFSATLSPNYTASWSQSRPAGAVLAGEQRVRTFNAKNLLGTNYSPYSCFLLIWSTDAATSGGALEIFEPMLVRTQNGQDIPNEATTQEIDLAIGSLDYQRVMARKNRIFQFPLHGPNPHNTVSWGNGTITVGSAGVYSGTDHNLPYTNGDSYVPFDPSQGTYMRADLATRLMDEGTIEFWYAPRFEIESRGGKRLVRLNQYDANGKMIGKPYDGDGQHAVASCYEDTGNVFDPALRHIFSLGNVPNVGSSATSADTAVLSGAGMTLVRCGNSLVWMLREPGFVYDGNAPADPWNANAGMTNNLECTRPRDKAFYKCQFDIPESMIARSTSAFGVAGGQADSASWMHVKLVWGPRMEMYVNGQLVDINPHQGFVTSAAMSETTNTPTNYAWNNARTGELTVLRLGNMSLSYRVNDDINQNLSKNPAIGTGCDRGFYYVLQSDNCLIQELGISNIALSQVKSATRSEQTNTVGNVDNAEFVSSITVNSITDVIFNGISVVRRYTSATTGTPVEYEIADTLLNHAKLGGELRMCATTTSNTKLYLKGWRTGNGTTRFRVYTADANWFPTGVVNNDSTETGSALADGATILVALVEPGASINYTGYIPTTISPLYLQETGYGRQACIIAPPSRGYAIGASTAFAGPYTYERYGIFTMVVKANLGTTEHQYNGYALGFGTTPSVYYIVRDWHVLANGWVVVTTEDALPGTLSVNNFVLQARTWSGTVNTNSANLFGLDFNSAARTTAPLTGRTINIYSCALEDKGFWRNSGTSSAWHSSDKLALDNPYPVPVGNPFGIAGVCAWYDGLWHITCKTGNANAGVRFTAASGSFTLIEDKVGAVVQEDSSHWIVKDGCHAIFKPSAAGVQFTLKRWWSDPNQSVTTGQLYSGGRSVALTPLTHDFNSILNGWTSISANTTISRATDSGNSVLKATTLNNGTEGYFVTSGISLSGDWVITMRVRVSYPGWWAAYCGISFGIQGDNTNGYRIDFGTKGFHRKVAGVYSDVGTFTQYAGGDITSTYRIFKLVKIGSTYTLYEDGTSLGSFTDANFASGTFGLYNVYGTDMFVDYVLIDAQALEPVIPFSTPRDITYYGDTKNALVFTGTLSNLIDWGSRDVPSETDKWVIEGRSRELDHGWASSRRMEYGDFQMVIANLAGDNNADYTGSRTATSYAMTSYGGIALTFHASEQYQGVPMAGGHYYPHLMPLYNVLTGFDSFWNSTTSPAGPDAGNNAVLYNANRWCRFPFHYKSIKYLYGRTGDDSANCYMRFTGHARQTDRGVMRVALRVLGGRYLQDGFSSEQVAAETREKFIRAQVVGEPMGFNVRALNSRVLDLDNLFNYTPAPQLWFDGRDWNLRQAGAPFPVYYNSAYRDPIGGFMFRSVFAESFDCLVYPQGWQGTQAGGVANLLVVGDGRMSAPGITHPTARLQVAAPVNFDPNLLAADQTTSGYRYKNMLLYPGVISNGSYTGLNVPGGVGGPAYSTTWGVNFGTYAMKPGTTAPWDNFLGHIKFRFEEGANFPNDYITHSNGLRGVKCIQFYKAQLDSRLTYNFHMGRDALSLNIGIVSTATATGVQDGRWYPSQTNGGTTQWWSGRIPQPQSYAVCWNFKRDIFPLNGRRVKMIGFATSGRRHVSMQTQAPTWNYPSDTQRGIETQGADLTNAPQSMFLRKADQEHGFRYPFHWDGSYVFTNNRLLGQWDSPYVLSDGGTYVASTRTSDTPLFTSPDLSVESDSARLASIAQYYKTVAAGQIRRFVVKVKNEGTAITFNSGEITLTLAASQGGTAWATKTNTGAVTIPADGTAATIIFDNITVPSAQPAGSIYATLHFPAKAPVMPSAVDMTIAGAASMNVQLHPSKNLTLYRHPDHDTDAWAKEQTIFRIGGDTSSSEDDLNPNGTVPMHELHYNRGNYVSGTHVQARVTRDHPYMRWDARVAKRIPEWMTGGYIGATTTPTIADLEGIDRDASYMQGMTSADVQETFYNVVDILATKINTEPYLYRAATSADYTGGAGQEQTLNKNAEYLRVHARNQLLIGNTTHKGSRMRLFLYGYVCGHKEFIEVTGSYTSTTASTNPLVTFDEQDPPLLSIPIDGSGNANLTFDLDRSSAADTILVEKGLAPDQDAAWGNWNLGLLNAATATRTRAGIRPYGMLTIYSTSPTAKEFSPVDYGDLHLLGDNYPEPTTYQGGGAFFTFHFQGRYVFVNNDIAARVWRFDMAPQDALTYSSDTWRNRDSNGCPYQGAREITGTKPYIKILGPPILTIKKIEQRHRDSTDFDGTTVPRINWNTEAAGCVRLEFDCQVVGDTPYNVDFLITTDNKRAFVRPQGWVDSLAIAGSTYLYDAQMHNVGSVNDVDMSAGATPHFTASCGNTPTRIKIDIDLKHFAYGGPTYDNHTGTVTIGITARRASPTISSSTTQAISYFCQDPTGFTLTFDAATSNFTQGTMNFASRSATAMGAGNTLYGNAQDLHYSYGLEGGTSYKSWTIMPAAPGITLDPMCQGKWNSIYFRVIDKYGNAATRTLAKPWDTDTPTLLAGTKLLPQNGDLAKSAIDIQSGSNTLYMRQPNWNESCPKTWGAALTVNGATNLTGTWNYSATETCVMPLGKHVEPTIDYSAGFASGVAPIWQVFHAQDFNTQNPAKDGRDWWIWDGDGGSGVEDTDLGVAAFHSWGVPRVVLQNQDICWTPIGNVPLKTMYNGVWSWADKVYITLKVDPLRGSNGYTTQAQPSSQPTWRCRFGWRHKGEADSDPIPHWKDFFVYDDGRWHTYVLDMSVESDWRGSDPDGRKQQFYIIFGASWDKENIKELPTDPQTIYFKYMMSNGDTTNLAAPAAATHVYLAHFGVAINLSGNRLGSIYTPMTLSGVMDGDDEILVSATLTDWGNRSVTVGGDLANKYYVIPKAPGQVGVSHNKSKNGLLEAKIVSVNQGGEPAAGVQYRIEWRAAGRYDDINYTGYNDWQSMSTGGTEIWHTASEWASGGYVLSDLQEGQRYFFRARARNPRNIACMSTAGPASEWFSDFIAPQFIGATHFTDATYLTADDRRPAGSSANVASRLASWLPVDVGAGMIQGAWTINANGRFYKSDWNGDLGSGKFYANLAASTDTVFWIDIRNFAGCKDGNAYASQGNVLTNHPVDGYFYTVTWGETTHDTIPNTGHTLWLATTTLPSYPILRLAATLNATIAPPCVGYMHVRPAYNDGGVWKLFDPSYTAHVALYFDRADGLHPAAGRIKTSFARGRDGDGARWNTAPNGDVWTIAAEVVPVLGINSSVERQMWHNYRLYAKPSGIAGPTVTGGWLDWQRYDPNGSQWSICGGLKEHQCYELNYQVRNGAGLLGPAPTTFGSPTYTNIRPPDTIVNVYPSGDYTCFVFSRASAAELGTPPVVGAGSYQIWDWMNGREIARVPFSGIAQYNVAVKLEGGLQGGYIVKACNNQGCLLIDYQEEPADWSKKPYQRQPGGWKPAIYDYLTQPRIGGITVGVGYNLGDNSGGNSKFLRALPAQGVNQDDPQRQIFYDPAAHPWLMENQLTRCSSDKYHNLTQYLTEVYKNDTNTRLGFVRGDGTLDTNYNESYWFDLLSMRSSGFQSIRADQMAPAATYGFRMRARQRVVDGTQPTGDTGDDALEGTWWRTSSWSDITWGNGTMRENEDYQDLLHLYVRAGGNDWWDKTQLVQDVNPAGKAEMFKDVRCAFKIVGAETTDVDSFPAQVRDWIRQQWQLQQGQPEDWWQLKRLPNSFVRLGADISFNDSVGTARTISRVVSLWDSEAKQGTSWTGWGVHSPQKDGLFTIHNDYGICKFNTYAPEVAAIAASGWISQQRTDEWYYAKWNLYDDALSGLETVGCPGSLKSYGATWDAVTNVRLSIWSLVLYGEGIYSQGWQQPGYEWRNDQSYTRFFERAQSGVLIRDCSVGWTWQRGDDAWNGSYEWTVQPMNIRHNPALDLYRQTQGDTGSLATARPKDFIYKKSTTMPANVYEYDSYVKEVVED